MDLSTIALDSSRSFATALQLQHHSVLGCGISTTAPPPPYSPDSERERRNEQRHKYQGRACRASPSFRKRKTVEDYVFQHSEDFYIHSAKADGILLSVMACRFCYSKINARSDRIKEHLASKKHIKRKLEAREYYQHHNDTLPSSMCSVVYSPESTIVNDFNDRHELHEQNSSNHGLPQTSGQQTLEEHNTLDPGGLSNFIPHQISTTEPVQELQVESSLVPPFSEGIECAEVTVTTSTLSPQTPRTSSRQVHPIENTSLPAPPAVRITSVDGNIMSNFSSAFTKYREKGSFVDVQIFCEGQILNCHRMVLASCSTYFETLLAHTDVDLIPKLPIICLNNIKLWEIQLLLDFMYNGQVIIYESQLESFRQAVIFLEIKGIVNIFLIRAVPTIESDSCSQNTAGQDSNTEVGPGVDVINSASTVNNQNQQHDRQLLIQGYSSDDSTASASTPRQDNLTQPSTSPYSRYQEINLNGIRINLATVNFNWHEHNCPTTAFPNNLTM